MDNVLVAGGAYDPNLIVLVEKLRSRGIQVVPLLIAQGENPALHWDLHSNEIALNHKPLKCSGVFYRRDVFGESGSDADYRAQAWFTVILGWLATCPHVRVLNRAYIGKHTNKLYVLHLAHQSGLSIPTTMISNDIELIESQNRVTDLVAKPVTGGGYCQSLEALLSETELQQGIAASPAIIQRRLAGPDVRIYSIDNQFIGFRIHSNKIDYRQSRTRDIELMDSLPKQTMQSLKRLMTAMGLDWCAADFKTDPQSDQLEFLEINSNPMFSAFDQVSQGRISDAIAGFLAK